MWIVLIMSLLYSILDLIPVLALKPPMNFYLLYSFFEEMNHVKLLTTGDDPTISLIICSFAPLTVIYSKTINCFNFFLLLHPLSVYYQFVLKHKPRGLDWPSV